MENNDEINQLAETLIKGGLINNKTEAVRMAKEMISTSGKIIQEQSRGEYRGQTINDMKIPPITEKISPMREEKSFASEERPKSPTNFNNTTNWTQEASKSILSNNEILKTINDIGRGTGDRDPNSNLTNMEKRPGFSKIENLYAEPSKGTNWLPAGKRDAPDPNFGNMEDKKPVQSSNNSNLNFNINSAKTMTPEEYAARNMSGNLGDMMDKEEAIELKEKRDVAIQQIHEHDKKEDFLTLKNNDVPQTNKHEDFTVDVSETIQQKEEVKPVEEKKPEQKKQPTVTEADKKLQADVDLSKIFNFGKR